MTNITLRSQVGEDGVLHLDIPLEVTNTELEVTITVKPVNVTSADQPVEGKGWPQGWFEETFGSFKNDPLVVDSEGVFN